MTGRQHLVAGAAIGVSTVACYEQIINHWSNEAVLTALTGFTESMHSVGMLSYPIGVILFFLGCLLPDCDSRSSTIGKHFYIPVEHRTWTHTLWFMLIFIIIAWKLPIVWYLVFGIFLHLLCDAFSRAGVCWLYPLSHYKKWGHAKVKNWHFMYLYSTEAGGWIVCGVLITLSTIYLIAVLGWVSPLSAMLNTVDRTLERVVSLYWH